MLKQILQARPMIQIPTPAVDYFFQDLEQVEHVPFKHTWEEAKDTPFCVLHTSGSTGIPKPVFVTYGTFACNDAHQLIPKLGGSPTLVNFLKGKRYFLALPLFHAACLTFTIGYNIFAGVISVIPPPEPLTADLANQVFTHGNLDGALLAPSLIVDCYNNNEYCVNMIQRLKLLSYVGGSLPAEVGNALTTRIKLMTLMGSCETALFPLELSDDQTDWEYLRISKYLGHTFRQSKDGYSELIVRRAPEYEVFQGVFSTFPEKQEHASGDLFEQHPNRADSWVFRARTDDIIAFTTAEKLNPITMESVISANPRVKSALVGGQGKFQAALLLEPYVYPNSKAEEEQYIKDIWPSVLRANRDCPTPGRIMKGFVMITDPKKPMPRAGKGTVQRHAALQLYAKEFEELYKRMRPNAIDESKLQEQQSPATMPAKMETLDDLDARIEKALIRLLPAAIEGAVQKTLRQILLGLNSPLPVDQQSTKESAPVPANAYSTNGTMTSGIFTNPITTHASSKKVEEKAKNPINSVPPPKEDEDLRQIIYTELSENLDTTHLTADTDLFNHGLDSLQVQSLVTTLNAYLIKSKPGVELLEVKQVYENPTVRGVMALVE